MRRRLARLRQGAVAPLMALLCASLLGFTGLAVDVGRLHLERRALQAAVDAAALGAARAPAAATALATSSVSRQGFGSASLAVSTGHYSDDPALPAPARFGAAGTVNAVRVSATTQLPLGLSRVLTGRESVPVTATATAAHRALASLSVGSGLATLEAGLANQVLGALLGGNVSLPLVTYQGLAGAQVGLLSFSQALATEIGLSAATFDRLASGTARMGQVLDVAASVLGTGDVAAATSLDILSQAASPARSLTVGSLLGLGLSPGQAVDALAANASYANLAVNALAIVQASAALGGTQSAVALPGQVDVPGLARATARLLVIEPPQGMAPNRLGVVGDMAQTAQTRLALDVRLLTLVGGGVVTLPLLVELAPATATLSAVSCQAAPGSDTLVRARATSGAATAQIGTIDPAAFGTPSAGLGSLSAAPVLNVTTSILGLNVGITILARAAAQLGEGSGELTFTADDVAARRVQSIAAGAAGSTLIRSLGGSLVLAPQLTLPLVPPLLQATFNGLLNAQVLALQSLLAGAIQPVLAALDPVVDQLLAGMGLRLGTADVQVGGTRCGQAALVL